MIRPSKYSPLPAVVVHQRNTQACGPGQVLLQYVVGANHPRGDYCLHEKEGGMSRGCPVGCAHANYSCVMLKTNKSCRAHEPIPFEDYSIALYHRDRALRDSRMRDYYQNRPEHVIPWHGKFTHENYL